jgi:hypothetical protein
MGFNLGFSSGSRGLLGKDVHENNAAMVDDDRDWGLV